MYLHFNEIVDVITIRLSTASDWPFKSQKLDSFFHYSFDNIAFGLESWALFTASGVKSWIILITIMKSY